MKTKHPYAQKRETIINVHGDRHVDPWFWLRNKDQPEVLQYLQDENQYTKDAMQDTENLQKSIYQEIRARIKEDDSSVPTKDGKYWYYSRFRKGDQYPLHCRKANIDGKAQGAEEIYLDVNQLANDNDFLELGICEVSPNHNILAYSQDIDGSERYDLHFRNLETGQEFLETINNTHYSFEWGNDNQTVYYTVQDENLRPTRVYRHMLGQDVQKDELIYEETDSRFFVYLSKSSSDRFIYITVDGNNMSEHYFLDANDKLAKPMLIQKRRENIEYDVDDRENLFYILHNDNAKDFALATCPIDKPSAENWQTYIQHQSGTLILGFQLYKDFLVVSYRSNALPITKIHQFSTGKTHTLKIDEEVYALNIIGSREWDSTHIRFSYSSMTTPASLYDYNMLNKKRDLLKIAPVLGGFDKNNYKTKRIFATSKDGVKIPISILHHKDTPIDSSAPLYLYAYGAYGSSTDVSFGSTRISLVDRGFIFAIAHTRGGKEMGWDWYEQGKLLNKKNTFDDFICCAKYLCQTNWTSYGNIVACGGSAGGMLMGVIANQEPKIFKAIIAHVPFVDVLNTMLDESLPLTTLEYNEWGNPKDKKYYDYIKSYSPYDNVKAQHYPNMLITGGLNDPRVTYWEPAKWVAKLRDLKQDNNLLLLKIDMGAGHGGASGRWESLKEIALDYAFILKVFNKIN